MCWEASFGAIGLALVTGHISEPVGKYGSEESILQFHHRNTSYHKLLEKGHRAPPWDALTIPYHNPSVYHIKYKAWVL